MLDFTSLIMLAVIMLGAITGDAAIYGDTLHVRITVPPAVVNAGFTEASAESVFTAEASRIVRGYSVIPAPTLRVSSSPTLISALAGPLDLDKLAIAVQDQFGVDHLVVYGAILAMPASGKTPDNNAVRLLIPATQLDLVMVVLQPKLPPVQIVLEEPDGDAVQLVKRAAAWSMEQVSPYRVVLAHFLDGMNGDPDGALLARHAADRFLARPFDPVRASERAMTHNVLALLALRDNNIPDAAGQLALAASIPGIDPQAAAELAINRSFVALTEKRPDEAAALLDASRKTASHLDLPDFPNHLDIQEALIAWAKGDPASAESKLRHVLAVEPESETAHHYMAMMLRAQGDVSGAAAQDKAALISHRFERRDQGLAVLLFWTDPINGGVTLRR